MPQRTNFVLKGIDIASINKRYGFTTSSSAVIDISSSSYDQQEFSTSISDLKSSDDTVAYYDESKRKKRCDITMADHITKEEIPVYTNIECFYCRNQFDSIALGVPVKYIPSQIIKRFCSGTPNSIRVMIENISITRRTYLESRKQIHEFFTGQTETTTERFARGSEQDLQSKDSQQTPLLDFPVQTSILVPEQEIVNLDISECDSNTTTCKESMKILNNNIDTLKSSDPNEISSKYISIIKKEYFECDGIVCSFNCMKSFIRVNKHDPMYAKSNFYMNQMAKTFFGKAKEIKYAPHWRQLKDCGGSKNIIDFRVSSHQVQYSENGCPIRDHPIQRQIGFLYEQHIHF
ncbi:MAG: hypothetical protein JKX76_01720 [Colwellia sp.]|nr:hypothetical protein [Colwellia sp.]